jgi:hypothetical protein
MKAFWTKISDLIDRRGAFEASCHLGLAKMKSSRCGEERNRLMTYQRRLPDFFGASVAVEYRCLKDGDW